MSFDRTSIAQKLLAKRGLHDAAGSPLASTEEGSKQGEARGIGLRGKQRRLAGHCSLLLGGLPSGRPTSSHRSLHRWSLIGTLSLRRPERRSERVGRRKPISPCSFFGSLLRGLHDPAGSSSSTTERGKSSFERVGGDGSRSSLNGRRRPGFASLDDLKVISKPSHSRSPPLRGDTYCLMQGVRFRLT